MVSGMLSDWLYTKCYAPRGIMKTIIFISLSVFITGCATTERYKLPSGVSQSDLAILHIYRTKTAFHSLNPETPYIYLDEKVIASLRTGQANSVKIPEGKYRLSVRQPILFMPAYESDSFEYNFESGKDYYIRYSMDFGGFAPTGNSVTVTGTSNFSMGTKEDYELRR